MINILHVQIPIAMQLSLVVFLVLLSFNKTIGKAIEQQQLPIEKSVGLLIKNPLHWIGIGFIFNFFYLLIELGTIGGNVQAPQLAVEQLVNLSFDLATTICFVIGSFRMRQGRLGVLTNVGVIQRKHTLLPWGIILLITPFVLLLNWGRMKSHLPFNWSLYAFDFVGYSFCSIVLLNEFKIQLGGKFRKNFWVFTGFAIWSILQIIGLFWNISEDPFLLLLAFTVSLVGKGSILYGLYDFSIKISNESDELKRNEVHLQKTEAAKLEAINKNLNEINLLIEEIYTQKDNTDLLNKMLEHLVHSQIFQFDYALFSEVDKFQEYIRFSGHALAHPQASIIDLNQWVNQQGFSLSHHDIMSRTVKESRVIHVDGNVVDGKEIDLDTHESILNAKVYRAYHHEKLNRFFLPVSSLRLLDDVDVKKESLQGRKVIGVIEVGFNKTRQGYNSNTIAEVLPALDLYLNNVAKSFLRNRQGEEEKQLSKLIESSERNAGHLEFLYKILMHCTSEIQADAADVSFFSLDGTQIWLDESKTVGSIRLADIKKAAKNNNQSSAPKKGIFLHVVETCAAYYTNAGDEDPYFIGGMEGINAQLSVPLKYSETVIGVLSFYSIGHNFNDDKQSYVQRIANLASEVFLRLKLSSAVSNLVVPYNMYDRMQVLHATYNRIHRYYSCSYVAIWEGNEENNHYFRLIYCSSNLKQLGTNLFPQNIDFPPVIYSSNEPIVVSLGESIDTCNRLEKAVFEQFKSIIYFPLGRNKGVTRLITLFSKAKVNTLFPEDKTFFAQLSIKLILSLNFNDIYSFFDKLTTETYQRSKYEILQDFLPYLKRISGADLPLLFAYDATQQAFFKVFGLENNFKQEQLIMRLESAEIMKNDFSYSIIKNGSQWIDNKDQYRSYRNTLPKWEGWNVFTKDFWEREKIKSLAAIRVEIEGEPLGVLFFNYREEEQVLNKETTDHKRAALAMQNQSLLLLLTNLIARVIKIADTFEEQRIYWEEQATDVFLQVQAETAMGMIHNIHNVYGNISYKFDFHKEELEKAGMTTDVSLSLKELGEAIFGFLSDYLVYRDYLSVGQFAVEKITSGTFFKELQQIFRYYLLKSQTRTKIIVEASESIILHCDRVQFGHVLLNLIKNAIEASARNITIKLIEEDSTCKFRIIDISDDGLGIKDELKPKIFQQRFTTKPRGTGMGLPVCKNVVEKHGGRIDFHSVYNKNKKSFTTFSVYLPILK